MSTSSRDSRRDPDGRPGDRPPSCSAWTRITGLQTARILAGARRAGRRRDQRPRALRLPDPRVHAGCVRGRPPSEDVVDVLVRLGPELGDRAALVPLHGPRRPARSRGTATGWRRGTTWPLPDHDVVEMLMDKVGFLRHALEHGLPIPGTVIVDDRADAERAARTLAFPVALKPPLKSARLAVPHQRQGLPGRGRPGNCSRCTTGSRPGPTGSSPRSGSTAASTPCTRATPTSATASRPLVTFVARKLRQWPPHTGTSALGEECRNDEVLQETLRLFAGVDYRGLAYVEMKRDARTGRHLIIEPNIGRPTGRSAIAEAGGVELLYTAYCDRWGCRCRPGRPALRGRQVDRRPP